MKRPPAVQPGCFDHGLTHGSKRTFAVGGTSKRDHVCLLACRGCELPYETGFADSGVAQYQQSDGRARTETAPKSGTHSRQLFLASEHGCRQRPRDAGRSGDDVEHAKGLGSVACQSLDLFQDQRSPKQTCRRRANNHVSAFGRLQQPSGNGQHRSPDNVLDGPRGTRHDNLANLDAGAHAIANTLTG